MAEQVRDHLMDHEYDGIQEFDNPTPGWWYMIFWACVFFSIFYYVFFTFSPASWTNADWYNSTVAANLRLQFAEIGTLTPDEPTLLKYMNDEKWLTVGKTVYVTQCQSCHAAEGKGLVGPAFTDNYYKNVKTITDIAKVVAEGANNGAMPPWGKRLHPNELVLVSSYVASLRAKQEPGMRIDGDVEIPPWPAAPAAAPAEKPKTP